MSKNLPNKESVVAFMRQAIEEFVDPKTKEVNATDLAEEAAYMFDCLTELENETSPLWDWAAEIAVEYELENNS